MAHMGRCQAEPCHFEEFGAEKFAYQCKVTLKMFIGTILHIFPGEHHMDQGWRKILKKCTAACTGTKISYPNFRIITIGNEIIAKLI